MTYPQQPYSGPGPAAQPQGYGYQPSYAQPSAQQAPAPAYQPQAPYMPPAQTPVAASWTPPQFTEPGGGGEGGSPLKIREIEGRICGVQPIRYIEATLNPDGSVKERAKIVVDVLILDGPVPFQYGASEGYQGNLPGPACYAIDSLPALIKGVTWGNDEIVKKAKQIFDATPGNTIPCRIVRGSKGNNPYFLAEINGDLDPGTTPEQGAQLRGMLGAAYAAVGTGRWPDGSPYVAPVPREINGGPRQKPNQANAQAAPAQPTYPPQAAPAGQVVYPQATAQHPIAQAYNAQAPAGQQYAPQPAAPFIAAGTTPPQAQYAPGSREAYLSGQEAPMGWNLDVWRQQVEAGRAAQFLPQQ